MVVTGAGMDFEDGTLNSAAENIWYDVETQKFYCELPELQTFLPNSFINKTEPIKPTESVTEEVLDSELPVEDLEDDGNFNILIVVLLVVLNF